MEAVKTNIIGADNITDVAIKNNVKKLIMLSTDKAVYPINAMGMTKALMEKIMLSKSRSSNKTIICCTRYGNVMGSRGSVIPLFIEQVKKNLPVTITNPLMTRFLMSLSDSVELVKFAFKHGKSGDIFVQRSPSATIETIAKSVFGILNKKINIKYIGTRHGEKLYESLISREEMTKAQSFRNYFKISNDNRDLNYDKFFEKGEKNEFKDEYNSHNSEILNVNQTKLLIKKTLK
jgi:UDP-glucose 4-epimerase